LINTIEPEILLPSHSEVATAEKFIELAEEMGYQENKNCFLLKNGHRFRID
jgi:mRNA degradation ribonuclease J1/J2